MECPVCQVLFKGYGASKYCSKQCYKKARLLREYPKTAKKCIICGKQFVPEKKNDQRYCSKKCSNTSKTLKVHPKITKTCPICSKEFTIVNRSDQVYCSPNCKDKANGMKNERKDRYFCEFCGIEFFPKKRTQKYCCLDCMKKGNRDKRRFSGNREIVLDRDGRKCVECGATIGLNVHHNDRSGQTKKRNDDPDNLKTLCDSCHKTEHIETAINRRKRIKVNCLYCGNEFETRPNRLKNGRGKFCSKECLYKSRMEKVKVVCQQCGKEFEVWPTRFRGNKQVKYCGPECQAKAQVKRKTVNCLYCGKVFEVQQYLLKKGKGKYCSVDCQHNSMKKHS